MIAIQRRRSYLTGTVATLVLLSVSFACETPTSPAALRQAVANKRNPPAGAPPAVSNDLSIAAITPPHGLPGDVLTLEGTGFTVDTTIALGGIPATDVGIVITGIRIKATAPARAAGRVDVVATNAGTETATLAQGFNFDEVTLAAAQSRVAPGGQVTVSWTVPGPRSGFDWIGLFKIGTPNEDYSEGWWEYTSGRPSGTFTFSAPPEGKYEFRYLPNDGYVDAARSGPITVGATP